MITTDSVLITNKLLVNDILCKTTINTKANTKSSPKFVLCVFKTMYHALVWHITFHSPVFVGEQNHPDVITTSVYSILSPGSFDQILLKIGTS